MTGASSWDWALFAFSLLAALVATYPAVENRSPVFVAVFLLSRAKRRSLPAHTLAQELKKRIQGHQIVRFTAQGGYIWKNGSRYLSTEKGRWIGVIFGHLQDILGLHGKIS